MSIPTKYKFKDYHRAVCKLANDKGLVVDITNKPGSGRRYEVFNFVNGNPTLKGFWVVHEDKYIWLRDMRKCLPVIGATEEELVAVLEA